MNSSNVNEWPIVKLYFMLTLFYSLVMLLPGIFKHIRVVVKSCSITASDGSIRNVDSFKPFFHLAF